MITGLVVSNDIVNNNATAPSSTRGRSTSVPTRKKTNRKADEDSPVLISIDSLKHEFYENGEDAVIRVLHKNIQVQSIALSTKTIQVEFECINRSDRLLSRYPGASRFLWCVPLQGAVQPECLKITDREWRMRKQASSSDVGPGNWGRLNSLSASTGSIRSANYTPQRSMGPSLSSYRYQPSSTGSASAYGTLPRSTSSTSAALSRTTSSGSVSLARSPTSTTTARPPAPAYARIPYTTRASAYSPATYSSIASRDKDKEPLSSSLSSSSAHSRYSIGYTPGMASGAATTHASSLSSKYDSSKYDSSTLPSVRARSLSVQSVRTPNVRDLTRMAAERAHRDHEENEYRRWEEREGLRPREGGAPPPPAPPPPPLQQPSYREREQVKDDELRREFRRKVTFDHSPAPPTSRYAAGSSPVIESTSAAKPTAKVQPLADRSVGGQVVPIGFTGLRNIGNTCFMNATLQMLVNCAELKEYFCRGLHKQDVNHDNVLGCGGRLADAFADFMQHMWSGTSRAIEPAAIKELVAEKASQFANYAQHDAHEFLSFLLDGLHEDLNRVKRKACTEAVEAEGRPDDMVAMEAWRNHLLRNDSIMVDLFHGQLKSRLQCPSCDRVSITFDPFVYLPVPFPKVRKSLPLYFWPVDPMLRPVKITVLYNPDGTVQDVLSAVSTMVNVSTKNLRLFEVLGHKFQKAYLPHEPVNLLSSEDTMFVFEVHSADDCGEEVVEVRCIQRQLYLSTLKYICNACGRCPKPGEQLKLKACEACFNAWYCNKECQMNDWNIGHRSECRRRAQVEAVGEPILVSIPRSRLTLSHLYRVLEARSQQSVEAFIPPQLSTPSEEEISEASEAENKEKKDRRSDRACSVEEAAREAAREAAELVREGDGRSRHVVIPEPRKKHSHKLFLLKKLTDQHVVVGDTMDEKPLLSTGDYISMNWYNVRSGKPHVDVKTRRRVLVDEERGASIAAAETARNGHRRPGQESAHGDVTLQDMMSVFSETERLKPEEAWYCNKCKQHVEATKRLELFKLPPVLIVQLKRFVYTVSASISSNHRRSKDERRVQYPLTALDLKQYLADSAPTGDSTLYDLCGVVCHSGTSYFGHYISKGRLPGIDCTETQIEWRNFDDSIVSNMSDSQAQTDDAYLLFYKQRGSGTKNIFRKHYACDPTDQRKSVDRDSEKEEEKTEKKRDRKERSKSVEKELDVGESERVYNVPIQLKNV